MYAQGLVQPLHLHLFVGNSLCSFAAPQPSHEKQSEDMAWESPETFNTFKPSLGVLGRQELGVCQEGFSPTSAALSKGSSPAHSSVRA